MRRKQEISWTNWASIFLRWTIYCSHSDRNLRNVSIVATTNKASTVGTRFRCRAELCVLKTITFFLNQILNLAASGNDKQTTLAPLIPLQLLPLNNK